MKLTRYWFKFNLENYNDPPFGTKMDCGVTAWSKEDALAILQDKIFASNAMPPILEVVEDIDITTLDENHIIPNMGVPIYRGIWFPLGY